MDTANNPPPDVWIVEDNAVFRKALAKTLAPGSGAPCSRQFDNAEALFIALRTESPDVLLLDIQLPGMDGISALEELRSLCSEVKAVVLTAFDDDDKIFRAICAGASGYLLKSAGKREIVEAVNEVVTGGAPMTPKVARRVLDLFALESGKRPSTSDYALTDREQEVLRRMADGLIKKEIAAELDVSVHTVNTHIRSIYEKLHVNTNTGAVAKAIREKLI